MDGEIVKFWPDANRVGDAEAKGDNQEGLERFESEL